MSIQPKTLKEFHAMLDRVIELQTQLKDTKKELEVLDYSSREIFVQAVELIRKEGFGDYEISELVREYLRMRIPKGSLNRYLSELKPVEPEKQDEEIEDSTSQSGSESDTIEDSSTEQETPTEITVTTEGSQTATPIELHTVPREPQNEDPKDLEIQFLKEKVAELEDALKKTEMFKPATQLQAPAPPISNPDEHYFKFLTDRADGVSSFYYDSYGIDLFKNRELSQLKNSGVKVFRRLYFEV